MAASLENGAGLASYAYDASGQRVSKTTASGETHFIHDKEGRLIAEHNGATGAPLREYIWLGMMPVAMVDHSSGTPTTYYIHTDQVMNPQKMTDSSGAVVWDRVATPFNVEVIVTGALTQPLKFPGQSEDTETTLFQNWHRDYDASLGRYVQSDLIGLLAGVNTYSYVRGNPLKRVDMTGLDDRRFPLNGQICNKTKNQCLPVDAGSAGQISLPPGMCTTLTGPNQVDADFFLLNGKVFKCPGASRCGVFPKWQRFQSASIWSYWA